MKKALFLGPAKLVVILAVGIAVPAFYLVLSGPSLLARLCGSALYAVTAVLMLLPLVRAGRRALLRPSADTLVDGVLACAALASAWPTALPWSPLEWGLRLGFCALAFLRMALLALRLIAPHHLVQIFGVAAGLLVLSGAGFWWLEPKVHSYGDGLWLAFITGATVGYGDVVPSTPASRILAVFIVLLGYAMLSVLTASISALFVNADEQQFKKELHADIRMLRQEIHLLRDQLNEQLHEQLPDRLPGQEHVAHGRRQASVAGRRGGQCDINTGIVIDLKIVRLTPPNMISRKRVWP